ncbi:acetate uptake transporter [Methanooceanicella nereidis]|uniref:acetate uptake transporter n=1 Tax=Methanooceanicella nereidis TaxID=2052831 RepID=UPI003F7099B6
MKPAVLGNPAPLGLMGFGMTTILLCMKLAGLIPAESLGMIVAMGIFYGGIAQVIAGWLEYHKGNTFAGTAFTSFGLFWILFIAIQLLPTLGLAAAVDGKSMGALIGVWGLFMAYMFIATLNKPMIFRIIFGSATVLFFVIAIGDYTGEALIKTIGGYIGIFCGSCAFYLAMADILNETFGRKVLPIG